MEEIMAEQYVNEDGSGRTRTIIIPDDVEFEGQGVVEAFGEIAPPPDPEPAAEPGDGTGPFGGGAPSDGGADSAANTEAEEAGNSGDESAG
jgi:hypothetical protein